MNPKTPETRPAPWILLRGLMRDRRHWGSFVADLRAAFPQTTVISLDAPGNGARHRERSPVSVEAMADDARAQLQKLGIAAPYRLLAMSLGAMVAVSWAQRYPQELQRLVLINTSLRPYCRFWERLRPGVYPSLLQLASGTVDDRGREARILQLTARKPHPPQLLDQWTAWHQQHPVSTANALRQLAAAARFRAAPDVPAVPTLMLGSLGDQLVHPRCSQRIAAAWGCPLRLHPDAGHDLPLDDAPWVLDQLREG